jgi:hypothetical protein
MDDKGSIFDVDGPSVLKIELNVPRPDMDKILRDLFCANGRYNSQDPVQPSSKLKRVEREAAVKI